jgi:GTP pyrophosphokinase
LDVEIRRLAPRLSDTKRQELVNTVAQKNGYNTADDLYNIIGYGELPVSKIMPRIQEELNTVLAEAQEEAAAHPNMTVEEVVTVPKPRHLKSNSGIVVDGADGCVVKFAKCCNPLPGDEVVGFVTKGYGISIHKRDCPNAMQGMSNPDMADRWKGAHWEQDGDGEVSKSVYEALLQVHTIDAVGVLADISSALADMKVSILAVNYQKASGGRAIMNLKISCKNVDHYNSIVSRLCSLENVVDVVRGFT